MRASNYPAELFKLLQKYESRYSTDRSEKFSSQELLVMNLSRLLIMNLLIFPRVILEIRIMKVLFDVEGDRLRITIEVGTEMVEVNFKIIVFIVKNIGDGDNLKGNWKNCVNILRSENVNRQSFSKPGG